MRGAQEKECHVTFLPPRPLQPHVLPLQPLFHRYNMHHQVDAVHGERSVRCGHVWVATGNVLLVALATALFSYSSLIPVLLFHRRRAVAGTVCFVAVFGGLHALSSYHRASGWGTRGIAAC